MVDILKRAAWVLCLTILVGVRPAVACDICGCFMGVTPYDNQSSLVLLHRYRLFAGTPGTVPLQLRQPGEPWLLARPRNQVGAPHSHAAGASHSTRGEYELFRTFELRATVFVHPRVETIWLVPYLSNSYGVPGSKATHASGLGDISTLVGYHVIKHVDYQQVQARWVVGAGIKWPTGKFYLQDSERRLLALASQLGTGSTDYSIYSRVQLGYRWAGLTATAAYRLTTPNYYKQRLGNGFTLFANLFGRWQLTDDIIILPAIQNQVENTEGEFVNGEPTGNHTLRAWSAGPGVDVFYRNLSFHAGVKTTLWQQATSHAPAAGQWLVGVGYNFKQKKYLVGRGVMEM